MITYTRDRIAWMNDCRAGSEPRLNSIDMRSEVPGFELNYYERRCPLFASTRTADGAIPSTRSVLKRSRHLSNGTAKLAPSTSAPAPGENSCEHCNLTFEHFGRYADEPSFKAERDHAMNGREERPGTNCHVLARSIWHMSREWCCDEPDQESVFGKVPLRNGDALRHPMFEKGGPQVSLC